MRTFGMKGLLANCLSSKTVSIIKTKMEKKEEKFPEDGSHVSCAEKCRFVVRMQSVVNAFTLK